MAYTSDIVYDHADAPRPQVQEDIQERARLWSQRRLFLSLFLIGTIIAAAGWFADWQHLSEVIAFFRYSVIITIAGHALEVIGAFGMMLTPDSVEGE